VVYDDGEDQNSQEEYWDPQPPEWKKKKRGM